MLNENQTVVNIGFWHKQGDDDHVCIVSVYVNVYPCYREGDTLFLETTVYSGGNHASVEPLLLTEFKITKITHSIKKAYGRDAIKTLIGLEVFVEKIEDGSKHR